MMHGVNRLKAGTVVSSTMSRKGLCTTLPVGKLKLLNIKERLKEKKKERKNVK
jgi:hypothetical protein